jgi:chemotaxis protein MotA
MGAEYDLGMVQKAFIDYPSVMITIGGTVAATLIANPLPRIIKAMKAMGKIFVPPKVDTAEGINKIIGLANLARKESLLALEESSRDLNDPFLQKGVMLIVDGTDPELVRNILETEMAYIEARHSDVRGIWDFIASAGPAWGMIGTLIGLALMLQNLSDSSTLGPKMAVALITTFYGSVLANFVATPVSNKLKIYSNEEMLLKEILIEGILSIQAGENPRIIEEKLKAFLSPDLRKSNGDNDMDQEAGDD